MTRSTENWVGKHDDEAIPARVKVRVFKRHNGVCPKCTRKMEPHKWQCDHIIALINGGKHEESNLQPLCNSPCHSDKTRADVAEKSRNYRKSAKHLGVDLRNGSKMQGRGFQRRPPQRTASRPIERKSEAR